MNYTDPYEDPFVIERADGTEIASAGSPLAIKDAARFLISSGEEAGPLTLRARHSGHVETAFVDERDPYRHVTISGAQGCRFS